MAELNPSALSSWRAPCRDGAAGASLQVDPGGDQVRVVAIALYSAKYPAAGETHGLSCVVAAIDMALGAKAHEITVIDMVSERSENLDRVRDAISNKASIAAISVGYGTYDLLLELRDDLRRVLDIGALVLVGGVLPTYLGHHILSDIDERIVVVAGEGESASAAIVRHWLDDSMPPSQAPRNTILATQDRVEAGPRLLEDLTSLPPPYRGHVSGFDDAHAQVFVESSRGCSWAVCSFCLRGLLDVAGRPEEYRRFPVERMLSDIASLGKSGVETITFADEDFFGGVPADVLAFLDEWSDGVLSGVSPPVRFDVSATIHSIFKDNDNAVVRAQKASSLKRARELGLNKVFLGIESGSPPQIRRYHKGHTPAEAAGAAKKVLDSGARLEIGFIMFDPLCSPADVSGNVDFLLSNSLAQYVSGPTSELRVQESSRYLTLLQRRAPDLLEDMVGNGFDRNTLTYVSQYTDPRVAEAVRDLRAHDAEAATFVYALKGLSRYGMGVVPGAPTELIREGLGEYRRQTLAALGAAMNHGTSDFRQVLDGAAARLFASFSQGLSDQDTAVAGVSDALTIGAKMKLNT